MVKYDIQGQLQLLFQGTICVCLARSYSKLRRAPPVTVRIPGITVYTVSTSGPAILLTSPPLWTMNNTPPEPHLPPTTFEPTP